MALKVLFFPAYLVMILFMTLAYIALPFAVMDLCVFIYRIYNPPEYVYHDPNEDYSYNFMLPWLKHFRREQ